MARVVVTGATGFIGRSLVRYLVARGDEVVALTRGGGGLPAGVEPVVWSPSERGAWYAALDGADAVVHLAGEPVFGRWTDEKRRRILDSRVVSTERLVEAMGEARSVPKAFVCASAVGYYGAHEGGERLDETSPPGDDFLARVVVAWEGAARGAGAIGARVVSVRVGVVLGPGGGALTQMMTPFKLFVGGPVGSGRQVISWVHERDVVGIFALALDDARARGPINATAPNAATMGEFARELGHALGRPAWLRVPSVAVRAVLGEAASAVLGGARVLPAAAEALGYRFAYPTLAGALAAAVETPAKVPT